MSGGASGLTANNPAADVVTDRNGICSELKDLIENDNIIVVVMIKEKEDLPIQ